ncbi:HypC/HybG/HupF family hydrogenase formation chaperone [Thauera mechernichensis]|uniref:HypC/HybG/HupF family hydrogenase formation chaperone n=1 Tax=Thauera mechernichensis TaxID=82788 RepID=A0ABW3WBK0_9RHOO|nr:MULTISPECIES: HypC/HybG/HupF family hydrogenase formation chaperone [Thauera]ENO80617.1 hydrogenase assembly chaperone hypC/hupF [Thauera sp. 27]MDG3065723.1 HypC/HybG/HupF family hydrogenase formation chaperone [Thauera mechernichensis]
MCLAIPARVVELVAGGNCRVELGGIRKEISLALVDDVAVGDYVIVHVGYALNRLDPEEAAQTLALLAAAGQLPEADKEPETARSTHRTPQGGQP